MPSIDPFHDLAQMMKINVCEPDHRLICDLTEEDIAIGFRWVPSVEEDRGAFNVFDEFDDEE